MIPERARAAVTELYETPKAWLAGVLEQGRSATLFEFDGDAVDRAALILAAIQGALQIARAEGTGEFTAVVREIEAGLAPRDMSKPSCAVRQSSEELERIEVE